MMIFHTTVHFVSWNTEMWAVANNFYMHTLAAAAPPNEVHNRPRAMLRLGIVNANKPVRAIVVSVSPTRTKPITKRRCALTHRSQTRR
jgi:hypothetical protein